MLLLAVIGSEGLDRGVQITAAHIDSPRLDLKPIPLYEDSELAYLKTHYYGGIRKYQWVTIPLELHGVVALKDGSVITVALGEGDEPKLVVNDLLPHLGGEQNKKALSDGIAGEQLNLLVGSEPLAGGEGERVKLQVMKLLYEKYGFTEGGLHLRRAGGGAGGEGYRHRAGPQPHRRLRPRRPSVRLRRHEGPL